MTDIDDERLRDRMQDVLQELEGEATGELVVSYVLAMRTTVAGDADSCAYRYVFSQGPVSERLGLVRYATMCTEDQVREMSDPEP